MAKISVVIPAYNPGSYLDETVQSVLAQTYRDWDCVIVDDGSREDLSRFDSIDRQVRRLRQDNRGLSIARNVGILSSQSEYVAFVDADDLWKPNKLALQLEMLESAPQMAFCHTAFEIIDAQSRVTQNGWAHPVKNYRGLLGDSHVCVSTVMVRRSCLATAGLFDPLLHATQDYDMWLKLARFHEVGFLPDSLALYRVHSSNMSGNSATMAREVTFVLKRHLCLARQNGDSALQTRIACSIRQARAGWGSQAFDTARAQWKSDRRGAARSLGVAARLTPLYLLRQLLLLPQRIGGRGGR